MMRLSFQQSSGFRALIFLWFTFLAVSLACSRADVESPGGVGSGGIAAPTTSIVTPVDPPGKTATIETPMVATSTPEFLEPVASPTFPPTPTSESIDTGESLLYESQPGDSIRTLAIRFGVIPDDIESPEPLPSEKDLIDPGQLLIIPNRLVDVGPSEKLLPDSEIIFSPHATDFDVTAFAREQGGYLNKYQEIVDGFWRPGPEVVEIVALDNSINPRILLALLEYRSGWVTDPSVPSGDAFIYPLGVKDERNQGLRRQLTWLASELGNGYYGWRSATLTDLKFSDRSTLRIAPDLNAGTVAIQYILSLFHDRPVWDQAINENLFLGTYTNLFGEPWEYEYQIFEPGVIQPDLILPFLLNHIWAFTGGPHGAWERESAWAALDFAPATSVTGCAVSEDWVTASAPGIVVRSEDGTVVLDLDGDGREQSGWALLYLHIAEEGRVEAGTFVEQGDLIGHPSCEGGIATGTHVHIARKYNGEWILADGPIPFELSGWVTRAGTKPYQGVLVKDGEEVIACPCASYQTLISRE